MQKDKKTTITVMVETEIWNKTKGYSEYMKMDKGDIVTIGLKLYFKSLDDFEKKMDELSDKEKGD